MIKIEKFKPEHKLKFTDTPEQFDTIGMPVLTISGFFSNLEYVNLLVEEKTPLTIMHCTFHHWSKSIRIQMLLDSPAIFEAVAAELLIPRVHAYFVKGSASRKKWEHFTDLFGFKHLIEDDLVVYKVREV